MESVAVGGAVGAAVPGTELLPSLSTDPSAGECCDAQLCELADRGVLLLRSAFSAAEAEALGRALEEIASRDDPGHVFEKDGRTLRAVHGWHTRDALLASLVRDPRLLLVAQRALNSAVYVYQFKANLKEAFYGDIWPWHQDFSFWHFEDGMPANRALNAALFLDDVTEFNGPLTFIPGSHKEGLIPVAKRDAGAATAQDGHLSQLSADLDYTLSSEAVRRLTERGGMEAPKGPAGSVVFFDPNVVHGSTANISPYGRRVVLITYNAVTNRPEARDRRRPEFLVCRDQAPLMAAHRNELGKLIAELE